MVCWAAGSGEKDGGDKNDFADGMLADDVKEDFPPEAEQIGYRFLR